jgi:hypothetical protein
VKLVQILAFNSSPRENLSKTELILQKFLEGAARAGADCDTVYLRQHHIKQCRGCFSCWVKTQGRCDQEDDMTADLFPRYLAADLVVLATPLYHFNMNARMKSFIERTLPMFEPYMVDYGERTGHPERFPLPPVVIISVCAFPELYNFQALSLTMRMIYGSRLRAEIYRHSSEVLSLPQLQTQVQQVLAATAQAGEEMARLGRVEPSTLAAAAQELASRKILIELGNRYWQEELSHEEPAPALEEENGIISKWV